MASTSMPPPPSPLARRRTRPNYQSDSSCLPRNMSLSKGATFHIASSPKSDADPALSIPHLTRRSPTCTHSSLASLLSEKRDLAAQHIADFEQTFSGARGNRRSSRRQSADEFNQQLKALQASLPSDEGIGSSVGSPASEKGLSKALARVEIRSSKDSALGDSIAESVIDSGVEAGDRTATALVQDTDDNQDNTSIQTRSKRANQSQTKTLTNDTVLSSHRAAYHPALSRFARKKILELVVKPILQEEKYKNFHPLVTNLASRTHKNVRCLRDLEQALIYQPLAQRFPVSQSLYRSFGEFTVQLTVDTFQHLSESDQRRATDQPYTSGYFLDLVQQVNQLAAHIGNSTQPSQDGEVDPDAPSVDDEITLEGGLGNTGEIAELVRWRNGKGISLRTGLPYEPLIGLKRQASTMTQDEIERSMARRKKGYIPEIVEMQCSDPTCDKIFTRKCDLAKHEKTHSRPFKCPHANCKYSEVGLPTEKERERHVNDKHDPNPRLYRCNYCEFKTKRESNCKQHMEKKHGWEYKRAKGKDKDITSTPAQTPHTPALEYDFNAPIQPSPAQGSYNNFDDGSSVSGSMAGSNQFTPYDEPLNDFATFNQYSAPLFPRQPSQSHQVPQQAFDFNAGMPTSSYDQLNGYASPVSANLNNKMTPVTPAYSAITGIEPSPYVVAHNTFNTQNQCYGWNEGLPTPESAALPTYSRNASVQYDSPLNVMERTLSGEGMVDPQVGGDMLQEDFTLFGGPFTNATGPDQTLFPSADHFDSQKFTASAFESIEGVDMDDIDMLPAGDEFDDLIDYDN